MFWTLCECAGMRKSSINDDDDDDDDDEKKNIGKNSKEKLSITIIIVI